MTAALAAIVCWLLFKFMLVALAICADSKRRDQEAAKLRHPANWRDDPLDEHWADVVAVFDDGKALVRETEEYLRSQR